MDFQEFFFTYLWGSWGTKWIMLTHIMLFISIPIVIFSIIRSYILYKKEKSFKFLRLYLPLVLFSFLCAYQVVPYYVQMFEYAGGASFGKLFRTYECVYCGKINQERLISSYEKAIKYSMIPWQKGAYYVCIAAEYGKMKNGKKMLEANDKAFSYVKRYNIPYYWEPLLVEYIVLGEYDKLIYILESRLRIKYDVFPKPYYLLSDSYLMKGNSEKALEYANLNINKNKCGFKAYALRGYIYKELGKNDLSQKDFEKAKSLCKEDRDYVSLERYKDYRKYTQKNVRENRKELGLD